MEPLIERGEQLDKEIIKNKFEMIGARVMFSGLADRSANNKNSNNVVDVINDKKGEIFDIRTRGTVDIIVPDVQAKDRHLLLMAKVFNARTSPDPEVIKTLCGHDEREFFAAQVPRRTVSNVLAAKQAL